MTPERTFGTRSPLRTASSPSTPANPSPTTLTTTCSARQSNASRDSRRSAQPPRQSGPHTGRGDTRSHPHRSAPQYPHPRIRHCRQHDRLARTHRTSTRATARAPDNPRRHRSSRRRSRQRLSESRRVSGPFPDTRPHVDIVTITMRTTAREESSYWYMPPPRQVRCVWLVRSPLGHRFGCDCTRWLFDFSLLCVRVIRGMQTGRPACVLRSQRWLFE